MLSVPQFSSIPHERLPEMYISGVVEMGTADALNSMHDDSVGEKDQNSHWMPTPPDGDADDDEDPVVRRQIIWHAMKLVTPLIVWICAELE